MEQEQKPTPTYDDIDPDQDRINAETDRRTSQAQKVSQFFKDKFDTLMEMIDNASAEGKWRDD